ncbi:MAG: nicotinate-nucleotide--dimethylbenzimidazole phosphoribosyltransferase [Arenicella sp.]|jgi:nicotinate-nucleotide--dimethylbenzimidazole phosphoribosyltransferase
MTDQWFLKPAKSIDQADADSARSHQLELTKPPGSLGRLEDIAVSFCAWQQSSTPSCEHIQIVVFAADHGVCAQGVSAFPQQVTAQMVHNFTSGGAAISVLAKLLKAQLQVVNLGLISALEDTEGLVNTPLMAGTNDFTQQNAMSREILLDALNAGRAQIDGEADLFIGGDMGIGNTSAASAIYSVLLKQAPELTVGPGTGVDKEGLARKRKALYQALNLHGEHLDSPLDILQRVGGLEIAGLVGAYIACAQAGVPILIDGFITTAAALIACGINPSTRDWMMFSHKSAEPAHTLALKFLNAYPLLDLKMRLGEGSGAAVAAPIIISALALHNTMATFDSAGISES